MFISSLFAKIAIPVVVLIMGAGFFLWQGGIGEQPRDTLANLAAAVPENPPTEKESVFDTGKVLDVTPQKIEESKVFIATEQQQGKKAPETPKPSGPPKATEPKAAPDAPFKFDPTWKDAVVNLYCYWSYGDTGFASGSGVIIDPRGAILTNAHVAGTFLYYDTPKRESGIECWVRTGSPSQNKYRAKLLYIPDEYIADDIATIGKYIPEEDRIHGKNDYALLAITKTVDPNATLPTSFPYLPLDTETLPLPGSSMYMVGYGASYVGGISVMYGLSPMVSPVTVDAIGSIKNSSTLDTLVFKGALSGQHGSSGGAVVRAGGRFTAIPAYFEYEGATTAKNILDAITIEYVNRDLKADTGFSLQEFMARDTPQALSQIFLTENAPKFHQMYVDAYAKVKADKTSYYFVPGAY